MQGYIIDIKPVKDDDLIVSILAENEVLTTYRFYGARHSNINIGYKIDFELENTKSTIPRLKDVIQLGFPWILDNEKMYCWQRYIRLFYPHLKDVEQIDPFYFYNLENLIHVMTKQNALRAICESYISLLEYEGSFYKVFGFLFCKKEFFKDFSLFRVFLLFLSFCAYAKAFDINKMRELFERKKLINFNDQEMEILWDILLQGL